MINKMVNINRQLLAMQKLKEKCMMEGTLLYKKQRASYAKVNSITDKIASEEKISKDNHRAIETKKREISISKGNKRSSINKIVLFGIIGIVLIPYVALTYHFLLTLVLAGIITLGIFNELKNSYDISKQLKLMNSSLISLQISSDNFDKEMQKRMESYKPEYQTAYENYRQSLKCIKEFEDELKRIQYEEFLLKKEAYNLVINHDETSSIKLRKPAKTLVKKCYRKAKNEMHS